ncbi:hypothetical protein PROFUN_04457 [Planoprotostelium fungivorum]|uniref:Phosphatidylinositol transfer protein N-terminal domain-containing protein n=1 Tax=Planoprotostelium fungivorum TaxID=1890364 RepID=A0A2P6NVP3_9EUKA|nr:hypothetical protein PROFUN_04457 [Planoprotostelium fungivorum]
MTIYREVRVVMPFSMDEFHKGQRYSVPRGCREATTSSDGIKLIKEEKYFDEAMGREGVYTEKIYYLHSYVPGYLKAVLPSSALRLEEKVDAWDCYPYCKTVITNPFMGEKFTFIIETIHKEMKPEDKKEETPAIHQTMQFEDNALNLPEDILKKRSVHYMDLAVDQLADKKHQKPSEDPQTFQGKVSKLGPLQPQWQVENWRENCTKFPMVCAYKLVTIQCKLFGLGSRVENQLIASEIEIFLKFHKQVFCWSDIWWNMTEEELEEHAKDMNQQSSQLLAQSPAVA